MEGQWRGGDDGETVSVRDGVEGHGGEVVGERRCSGRGGEGVEIDDTDVQGQKCEEGAEGCVRGSEKPSRALQSAGGGAGIPRVWPSEGTHTRYPGLFKS